MSESTRKRLMEISKGSKSNEIPLLIKRVVKIQALFRGFMVRSRLETLRNLLKNGTQNGEFDDYFNESDLFTNSKVKEVYDREGAFRVPDLKAGGHDFVAKGPFRLTSGAIYMG